MQNIREKLKYNQSIIIYVFICNMLFGMAAHGYCYFNLSYSHDSLMVYQRDIQWQITLGRFLQPAYLWFRGQIYTPFLVGVFSLIYLSISVYLVVKILNLKSKISMILICGILSTNATLTFANATFLPWVDIFMLSLLLSVLSVYMFQKYKSGFFTGAVFLSLSLALYQSYFQVAVLLFMILTVKKIFDGLSTKDVLLTGIKALLTLFLGLLIYYTALKIVLYGMDLELANSYNGIADVGNYSNVSIKALIYNTYLYVLRYYFHPETYHSHFIAILNIIIFILSCLLICRFVFIKRISKWNYVLLIALMSLMPFGMNIIFFISKGMEHSLMIFSFFFLYIFVIMILELYGNDKVMVVGNTKEENGLLMIRVSLTLFLGFIILNNNIFSNQVYLKKDLEYQATLSVMSRIIDRIEQTEGYLVDETPVAIVGTLNSSVLSKARDGFLELTGVGMDGNYSVTYYSTYNWYLNNVLGYPINLMNEKQAEKYAQMEEVKTMPAFPAKGSCMMIGEALVVKLS